MHVINVRIKYNITLILFKNIIGRFNNRVIVDSLEKKKTEIHKISLNLSERPHEVVMRWKKE